MLIRREARVGLVVFVAILVLIAVYWFLGGIGWRTSTYPIHAIFTNARKLDKGADVRMAGVKVGIVESVELTRGSRARVNMLLENGNKVPQDSVAHITAGGLIGDNYIEIVPGDSRKHLKPGQEIASAEELQFDQLMAEAGKLLQELQTTAKSINAVLGDKETIAAIKKTVLSLEEASGKANKLMDSAQNLITTSSPEFQRVLVNMSSASADAADISAQLKDLIEKDARPNLRLLIGDTRRTIGNLNEAIGDAQVLLAAMSDTPAKLNDTLDNVAELTEKAQISVENINAATGSVKDLATDPQLQAQVRQAVQNLSITSEQAKQLITSLNKRYGSGGGPTPVQKSSIPNYGLSMNGLWNTDKGEYRFDANYTFTFGGDADDFYRAGLYNIGENTRVNLQGGLLLDRRNAFRYGLYASRVGIGYDRNFGRPLLLSADLFRPNDPQLEVRGILRFGDAFGLYGGLQDVFDKDNRDILVGIQYNK